jgi:hypothetical protein
MAAYFVRSAAGGTATGASWTNAYTSLHNALAGSVAAGDTIWVADDHAEVNSSSVAWAFPGTLTSPNFVYCVDHTVTSPIASSVKTGATITSNSGATLMFDNSSVTFYVYVYGIAFTADGFSFWFLNSSQVGSVTLDTCSITLTSGNVDGIDLGGSSVEWINTPVQFGATGQSLLLKARSFVWRDTAAALGVTTFPTSLVTESSNSFTSNALLRNLDLSGMASSSTIYSIGSNFGQLQVVDCKTGSGVVLATTPVTRGFSYCVMSKSDSSGTTSQLSKIVYEGAQYTETAVVRTGGASDGTGFSRRFVTTANVVWWTPFDALPIAIWNTVTGANVNVTLYGIWNSASLPNNDQSWFDVEYLGTAASPRLSLATGTKANNLATGTALTADTSAWDSAATARANSTAYVLGNVYKVATNSGRVFFCTTAGTSSGSEPAGLATATDGSTAVTDGSAAFRAGVRFKQVVALTTPQPQIAGIIRIKIRVAATSSTVWWDSQPVLS